MGNTKLSDQELIRRLRHPVSMAELHSVQQYILDAPEFQKKARAIWKKKGLGWEDFESYYFESMRKLFEKVKKGEGPNKESVIAYFLGIFKKDTLHAIRALGLKKQKNTQSLDDNDAVVHSLKSDTENWEEQKMNEERKDVLLDFIKQFAGSDCVRLYMMTFDQANNQEILEVFGWQTEQTINNKRSECLKKLKNAAKDDPRLNDNFKY